MRSGRRFQSFLLSTLFIGPAVLLYGGFIVLPAVIGFGYSLSDWNGWDREAHFIGVANFVELLHDERFFNCVKFTLIETVLMVVCFSFGAMVLAVLLDRLRYLKGFIRALFFYPYVLSVVVSGLIFQYVADYRAGAVNQILRGIGLADWAQEWMGPDWAMWLVLMFVVWTALGFFMTVYLANLQTIPQDLYEAARLDGASAVTIFRAIQLPMLVPALTINSVLALITGINLFPQIVVLWGSPRTDTYTIGYYIYKMGILNNRQGYATAISLVTFVALAAVAMVQVAVLRRRETQL